MIRTSTAIGVAAFALSILVHFLGIALTLPEVSLSDTPKDSVEQIATSAAFEDLVEVQVDPVEPELAEPAEPPIETPPEPERAEAPTSQALVASDNPQNVTAPDRGAVQQAQPNVSGPVSPATAEVPQPEVEVPSGGTETAISDARVTPPVGSETDAPPLGSPEAAASITPPVSSPIAPSAVTAPESGEQTATPDVLAALPLDAVAPQDPLPPLESESSAPDDTGSTEGVPNSLRPQIRPESLKEQPSGTLDGTANASNGLRRPTELIESPLTAYKRDGTNLFSGRRAEAQPSGSLGPGNSDVTNYAGRVLMHLNRVQPVAVSTRGWARVVFRIEPDGTLGLVDIIDGSGSREVEAAAKAHVRRGMPFPRPPGGDSRVLNFVYQIR